MKPFRLQVALGDDIEAMLHISGPDESEFTVEKFEQLRRHVDLVGESLFHLPLKHVKFTPVVTGERTGEVRQAKLTEGQKQLLREKYLAQPENKKDIRRIMLETGIAYKTVWCFLVTDQLHVPKGHVRNKTAGSIPVAQGGPQWRPTQ